MQSHVHSQKIPQNKGNDSSSVDHHLYADDTQLFISFSSASFSTSIAHLLSVVNQISQWMSSNLLYLNPSKTEFIIIGLPAQIIRLSKNSSSTNFIFFCGCCVLCVCFFFFFFFFFF